MIYKILRAEEWDRFQSEGVFHGAPVDFTDGFIHLSSAGQVAETAWKHFRQAENLTLLAVDDVLCGDNLKWEPSRGGALFPHLYAPLPMTAVAWSAPLPLGPDGRHVFPEMPS